MNPNLTQSRRGAKKNRPANEAPSMRFHGRVGTPLPIQPSSANAPSASAMKEKWNSPLHLGSLINRTLASRRRTPHPPEHTFRKCQNDTPPVTRHAPQRLRHPVAEDATSELLFSKHKPTNPKYETKNNPPRNCHHPADPLFKHLRAGMRRRGRFPGPTQRESLRRQFHGESIQRVWQSLQSDERPQPLQPVWKPLFADQSEQPLFRAGSDSVRG